MIEQFGPAIRMSSVDWRTLQDGAYFAWSGWMRLGLGTENLSREVIRSGRIQELEGILITWKLGFFTTLFVKNGKVLCQHSFHAPQACWEVEFVDDRRAMGIVQKRNAA